MAYSSWSVVFGEQPSAAKWNILGTNDAHFYTYTGEGTNAIQQFVYNTTSAVQTGSTTIPFDDTIPQITEGNEYFTQAITPKSATNLLEIKCQTYISSSAAGNLIMALFQDATASALAVSSMNMSGATMPSDLELRHVMVAGTTSSTTFRIRCGNGTAGTTTINGYTSARSFGTAPKSILSVTEYKV